MVRVLAQGAFEVLHPAHIHYLRASARLGESLWVMITPDEHINGPIQAQRSRREMVGALNPVDRAVLGSIHCIEDTLSWVDPDLLTLREGADNDVWTATLRGIELIQIESYRPADHEITTLSGIKDRYEKQKQS